MKSTLLFWITLCFVNLFGQINEKPLFYSFSPKEGFLIAHRPNMTHLVRENSNSFEFAVWQQLLDSNQVNCKRRLPLRGLSLECRNFGYNEVLGQAVSSTAYMVYPLFQTKKSLFLDLTLGVGAGYLTKKYDKVENPLNNAIGSHCNGRVNLKLSLTKYYRNFHFGGGIEFMHFSNGSITTPNLGLNSPSIFFQVGYQNTQRIGARSLDKSACVKLPTNHRLGAELIVSAKEIGAIPFEAKRYPVIAARLSHTYSKFGFWGSELGLDIVHNEANFHKYHDTTFVRSDILQIGFYGGGYIRFNKTELAFGLGIYLRDPINAEGMVYNRIGYRYFFKENWFAVFTIKANAARADYFEFGIGYHFLKR